MKKKLKKKKSSKIMSDLKLIAGNMEVLKATLVLMWRFFGIEILSLAIFIFALIIKYPILAIASGGAFIVFAIFIKARLFFFSTSKKDLDKKTICKVPAKMATKPVKNK
jgi:hypothetical protein